MIEKLDRRTQFYFERTEGLACAKLNLSAEDIDFDTLVKVEEEFNKCAEKIKEIIEK